MGTFNGWRSSAGLSATRAFDIDQHASAKGVEAVLSLTGDFQTQNQENPTAAALLKVGQKMGHFSGQFGAPLQIISLFLLSYKEVAVLPVPSYPVWAGIPW